MDNAWIQKIRKIIWQIPYASSTPSANDASIAPININELITKLSPANAKIQNIPAGESRQIRGPNLFCPILPKIHNEYSVL